MSQKFDAANPMAPDAVPAIRVAVCGEVSSGKSTVLNAMLRAPIFPDNLGSRCRPVIVAGYRAEPGMEILYPDGTRTTVGTLDDPDLLRDAAHVMLWSDQAHIAGLEVVEVPLTKAEMLTEDQVEIIRSSDVMIWVTIASQAWRLTEKTIVEQLGDARPARAILAVTRADKLRSEQDRERLKDRIVRETAQYFQHCVFINGTRKKIGKSESCDEAWNETGVVEILSTIRSHAGELSADRAECAGEESEPRSEIAEIVDLDGLRTPPAAAVAEVRTDAPDTVVSVSEVPQHDPSPEPEERAVDASEPADDAATADASGAAKRLLSEAPGLIAAGLVPFSGPADIRVFFGDEERARTAGTFCHNAFEPLFHTFASEGEDIEVSSFTLSMQRHRILFRQIPETGLAFVMVDAAVASHGSAHATLSGLCNALAPAT